MTEAIEAAVTLDELLLLTLREITQIFDIEHAGVLLGNEDGTSSVACAFPPHTVPQDPITLTDMSALWQITAERRTQQLTDVQDLDHAPPLEAYLQRNGVRTALLVPLIAQDQTIGVLFLGSTDDIRPFSDDEMALARVLAGQLSTAVAAFRLNEAARLRNEELSTLNEIAATVTSTLDTREIYRAIVQQLNTSFNVDAGSILLLDEASGELEFVMTIEHEREVLLGMRVPKGRGVVGHVAATGTWEIVPDAQNDPRFYRKISDDVGYETHSILCVPIPAKDTIIGVIELLNKLDGPFTRADAERLTRMATFIGVALENARLFQKVADGRDELAAILDSTADGMVMVDLAGNVVRMNTIAARLFGAPEAELQHQSLGKLLQQLRNRAHAVTTRSWSGQANDDASDSVTFTEYELGGQRRRFVRHSMLPVNDATGKLYGRLAIFRDVTVEKELEQLRDDYTSMLVHDLRAPLTSVMNGIAMTQRGLGGPVTPQQRDMLAIAQAGSQAMLELVNNLLDISRLEQGRLHLDLEPLAPYAILDAAIERLDASARARQITIEQHLSPDLPTIEADEATVVRVLQNLLDNALKFSPAHSTVTIGAARWSTHDQRANGTPVPPSLHQGSWIVFWVQDRGLGIPAAYRERIFEKFGQVRNHKSRGTGLGLTFCKLAVEAHGGSIWLESEVGAGSLFAFALPLERH